MTQRTAGKRVVVFDDGTTWQLVEGVSLCTVDKSQLQQLRKGVAPRQLGLVGVPILELLEYPKRER